MEKPNEIDRICFKKKCKAMYLFAFADASLFIESLDLNNLEQKMRIRRFYIEIVRIEEAINQLNRHLYAMYYRDKDYLYDLLKSTGRLNCPEEMEKLQMIIMLKEKQNALLSIKMDLDIIQQAADFFSVSAMELPPDVFLSGGTAEQFVNKNPSLSEKKEPTTEQILTNISLQLYVRIGIFKDPGCIAQFVRWVMNPNRDKNEAKMYIDCMTNEFKCCMFYFRFFNKKLSKAVIGRFGVFISKGGIAITANNLRSTSYKNLNTRRAIANIFAPYL